MSAIRKWAVFEDIRFPEPHVVVLFTQNVRSQSSEPYLKERAKTHTDPLTP